MLNFSDFCLYFEGFTWGTMEIAAQAVKALWNSAVDALFQGLFRFQAMVALE